VDKTLGSLNKPKQTTGVKKLGGNYGVRGWGFASIYQDGGQVVKEDSPTIAPNGTEATEFHMSKDFE
jgi:hypothetical protein